MKIIVVSKYCDDSARELVQALQANKIDAQYLPPIEYESKLLEPHRLFAYGWSGYSHNAKERINTRLATKDCIDKATTFRKLADYAVPIPAYELDRQRVPKTWNHVVVRKTRTGRKAEGFDIVYQPEQELPDGELYTEYFYHKYEYRVVVFKEQVFVYYKRRNNEEEHELVFQDSRKYPMLVEDARKAAKALNIDYVGFDVVAQNKRSYRFLEANSGPILCDEVCNAIVDYYSQQ